MNILLKTMKLRYRMNTVKIVMMNHNIQED
jgi:hypothetical protein